ncbi:hypothetical protein I7I48_03230 [Histoplasma ohiense]|nr:hypothetical protein I7I48_03230 [Histoplasma ohiense (nom. inval.)]
MLDWSSIDVYEMHIRLKLGMERVCMFFHSPFFRPLGFLRAFREAAGPLGRLNFLSLSGTELIRVERPSGLVPAAMTHNRLFEGGHTTIPNQNISQLAVCHTAKRKQKDTSYLCPISRTLSEQQGIQFSTSLFAFFLMESHTRSPFSNKLYSQRQKLPR